MIDAKLETLLTVIQTGNYTKAADILCLTQPAVSQHIRQLEGELGVKIFNRLDNKNFKITTEGEIVVKYANRIKTLYDNLEISIRNEKKQSQMLAIGVTASVEHSPVLDALALYASLREKFHFKIIADTKNNLLKMLKIYDIDIAFMEGKAPDNYNSILLDTDTLMLVVPNGHRLTKKSVVTIDDIKNEPLILRLPNSGTRNLFVSHLESQNRTIDEFNIALELDSISTIKDLIKRNFGVSILARSVCLEEMQNGTLTLIPIESLSMSRPINIVYHKDFEYTEMLNEISKKYFDMVKLYEK